MRTLTHEQAKAFYDRFGSKQDRQTLYEDRPLQLLIDNAGFDTAEAVFEFGCGTGRLGERLLTELLPPQATYTAVDISDTMTRLASERMAPWGARADIRRTTGSMMIDAPDESYDRFVCTYVCDLLSVPDINRLLEEAHRVLRPGGLVCLTSLTAAHGIGAKLATGIWRLAYLISPALMGGCRPIRLWRYVYGDYWEAKYRRVICPGGLCTEVLIATRIENKNTAD